MMSLLHVSASARPLSGMLCSVEYQHSTVWRRRAYVELKCNIIKYNSSKYLKIQTLRISYHYQFSLPTGVYAIYCDLQSKGLVPVLSPHCSRHCGLLHTVALYRPEYLRINNQQDALSIQNFILTRNSTCFVTK
jgi:hypothetical protein